jgi:CheY-like chemotaxis protein
MGEGTVLVIEDEKPLVKLFREILERFGYRVLVAETGKEAVDLALLDRKPPCVGLGQGVEE